MPNEDLILQINGLTKGFQTTGSRAVVLDQFSAQFAKGSLTIISGPNGAGKTVLAKCISGLMPFDLGSIALRGNTFTKLDRVTAKSLGVEYLPQHLPKPSGLSAMELLAMDYPPGSVFFSPKKITSKVKQLHEQYALEVKFDLRRSVSDLSPSEVQRLFIFKALISDASIFILDEPTAYLSGAHTQELGKVLSDLTARGITVIMIAHPEQHAFVGANVLGFTSRGLVSEVSRLRNLVNIPLPAERIRRCTGKKYVLSLPAGPETEIVAGSIVCIEGRASDGFRRFSEALRSQPHRWLRTQPADVSISVATIPADSVAERIASNLTLWENCLIKHWAKGPWRKWRWFISKPLVMEQLAKPVLAELNVQPQNLSLPAGKLSGGNIQRLVVSRECIGPPDVLIATNIFRGLDDDGIDRVSQFLLGRGLEGMTTILLTDRPGVELRLADIVVGFHTNGLAIR